MHLFIDIFPLVLYYCPNKGINQVYPYMSRQNLNGSRLRNSRRKEGKRSSIDLLKLNAKPIQTVSLARPQTKIKRRNIIVPMKVKRTKQSSFDVKIQKKNKENTSNVVVKN